MKKNITQIVIAILLFWLCACSTVNKEILIDKVICSSGPLSTRNIEINNTGECFFAGNRFSLDSIRLKDNKFDCSGNTSNHYRFTLRKETKDSLFKLLSLSDFFNKQVIHAKTSELDIGQTAYNMSVYYNGGKKKTLSGANFSKQLSSFVHIIMQLAKYRQPTLFNEPHNFETTKKVFAPLPDCL